MASDNHGYLAVGETDSPEISSKSKKKAHSTHKNKKSDLKNKVSSIITDKNREYAQVAEEEEIAIQEIVEKKKKKKSKKAKAEKDDSKEEEKGDANPSSQPKTKKKKKKLGEYAAVDQQSLASLTPGDAKEVPIEESLSIAQSPKSSVALNPLSPLTPAGESISSVAKKSKKKSKKKVHWADDKGGVKPKKLKTKNSQKRVEKPKKLSLLDGLNLVGIMTDKSNCKKTKLFVILFTLTVLCSIILNVFELRIFINSPCPVFHHSQELYLCFSLMVILKLFIISLFNLELTFRQPYKSSPGLIYPLAIQCFSPILQLPQSVFDFHGCHGSNRVVLIQESWNYVQAALATMGFILLYLLATRKINIKKIKFRVVRFMFRLLRRIIALIILAWSFALAFFTTKEKIFLPSLFFDVYLYGVLIVSALLFYAIKKNYGKDTLRALFVKDEKNMFEPLNQGVNADSIQIEIQE